MAVSQSLLWRFVVQGAASNVPEELRPASPPLACPQQENNVASYKTRRVELAVVHCQAAALHIYCQLQRPAQMTQKQVLEQQPNHDHSSSQMLFHAHCMVCWRLAVIPGLCICWTWWSHALHAVALCIELFIPWKRRTQGQSVIKPRVGVAPAPAQASKSGRRGRIASAWAGAGFHRPRNSHDLARCRRAAHARPCARQAATAESQGAILV